MLPENMKNKWLEGLRSGKFEQGQYQLKIGHRYCCLGVFAEVNNIPLSEDGKEMMSDEEYDGYNPLRKFLEDDKISRLYNMNDSEGCSFNQIADYIEQNL